MVGGASRQPSASKASWSITRRSSVSCASTVSSHACVGDMWRQRDSDHDHPTFRNLAKDKVIDGANQLWVADITYVAVASGFVYVAVILDAWSRRVVGYAISRSIDVRLTLAALNAAIEDRKPPAGCLHHSDSQRISTSFRAAWLS